MNFVHTPNIVGSSQVLVRGFLITCLRVSYFCIQIDTHYQIGYLFVENKDEYEVYGRRLQGQQGTKNIPMKPKQKYNKIKNKNKPNK